MRACDKESETQAKQKPELGIAGHLAMSVHTFRHQGVGQAFTGEQMLNDTVTSGQSSAVAHSGGSTSWCTLAAMTVLTVSLGFPFTAQASDPVCQLKIRQLDRSIEQVRQLGPMHRVQLQSLQNAQSALRSNCTASKAISWQRNAIFDAEENIAYIYDAMRSAAADPDQIKRLETQLVQARKQASMLKDELAALQAAAGQ